MNIDNAKSQMRKGMLEYCIMLLLRRQSSYAADIIQKLKEAKLIVVEGTLYPLLTRLKNDKLLSYEWRESTQGPPRKYYVLTETGELFLAELDKAWSELTHTVNVLTQQQKSDIITIPPPYKQLKLPEQDEKEHHNKYVWPALRHRRGCV